jgi:hypothetical protein
MELQELIGEYQLRIRVRIERILADVLYERARQETLHSPTCADPSMPNSERLEVLGEEFGEVCKALVEIRDSKAVEADLRAELVQVAAVAVAWLEAIDQQG